MLRAIQILAPAWFRPAAEKDDDNPAEFLLAGLTGSQQADIGPHLTVSPTGSITFSRFGIQLLFRYGLRDWRGVLDDDDKEIDMQSLKPGEIQDLLPYTIQVEVAGKVLELSQIGVEDKKKS